MHVTPLGLDKRQLRRWIRRNDMKHCNCGSLYDADGSFKFIFHYDDCLVAERDRYGLRMKT